MNTVNLLYQLIKYNLKIIFAGKFIGFFLAALLFFSLSIFQYAWGQQEITEETIYAILLFPGFLLVFYPTVFALQNDDDARIMELLFSIPDYRYKIWSLRLLIIYLIIYLILLLFTLLASILLYPVGLWQMTIQLMFPVIFFGNISFMLSTLIRSGNTTATIMILFTLFLSILYNALIHSFWNILLNPYHLPPHILPVIWKNIILKNRIFLLTSALLTLLISLLNLQKRERYL